MTRAQAIRKVQACLRLASSNNPNEAAAALRQARALMDKYGLTETDAAEAEIHEREAPTGFRGGMIPESLMWLSRIVADGYRCEVVVSRYHRTRFSDWGVRQTDCGVHGRTTIRFFGAGASAEIAAYAFTVLRRQLAASRNRHTARIRKRVNKEARGEAFALGWISAVQALFPSEELPQDLAALIDTAIARRVGETKTAKGKTIGMVGRASADDHMAGYLAGKNARFNAGLGGKAANQLERL